MPVPSPVADLLTRIRNAQGARHDSLEVPFSKLRAEVLRILKEEGYISAFKVNEQTPFSTLSIVLKYSADQTPVIRVLQCVSTPGRRCYVGKDEIPPVLGGLGISIISTSKGLLTGKKASEMGVGGELLCEVY